MRAIIDIPPESKDAITAFITDSGLLTAAERIQRTLPDSDLASEIQKGIYGNDSPASVVPGPLTRAVAQLKIDFPAIKVITTNYDQLIVSALRAAGVDTAGSYCVNSTRADAVIHLHGVIGYEYPVDGENDVILTEHDFLAPSGGGWRRDVVAGALDGGSCMFLGASLTDLNLLAPLHRAGHSRTERHVVVFVRDPHMDRTAQQRAEEIDRERWSALGVKVVYADNFGDVAQFVTEVRLRRAHGKSYRPLPQRLERWHDEVISLLVPDDYVEIYRDNQLHLVDELEKMLEAIQAEFKLDDEVMQLGLFGLGCDADAGVDYASVIATSDRVMRDPRSAERLATNRTTSWAGVRAMITATPVAESKDNYASRWKYMLGVPITIDDPLNCCIGSIVLSSTASASRLRSLGGSLLLDEYQHLYSTMAQVGRAIFGLDHSAEPDSI